MPIEIKELHIKVNVEEQRQATNSVSIEALDIHNLKADIIKDCTKNILEKLKEISER